MVSVFLQKLVEWTEQRNGAKIVSFDHLSDEYVLCAVLSSGVVLIVDYENGTVGYFAFYAYLRKECFSKMLIKVLFKDYLKKYFYWHLELFPFNSRIIANFNNIAYHTSCFLFFSLVNNEIYRKFFTSDT